MGTILRAIGGYFFLLITVRVLSRRPGAQLTPFEFVLVFIIGGIIIQSVVSDDRSMTNSVCTVLMIGSLHMMIGKLKHRSPRFQMLVDGTPLVLLDRGQWQVETMHNMRIQDTDVMAAARIQGLENLSDIKYAVLERNGAISIVKTAD